MRIDDVAPDAIETARVYLDEGNQSADNHIPEELDALDDLSELMEYRTAIQALSVGAAKARTRVEAKIAAKLGEGGIVRFGDQYASYHADSQRTLTDPNALLAWLSEDVVQFTDVEGEPLESPKPTFNPSHIRVTDVRRIARDRFLGQNPDATEDEIATYLASVEQTFYYEKPKPPKPTFGQVSRVADKMPWLDRMPDGKVWRPQREDDSD